jgi:adenine-specific DNA-methyltransferase
MPVPELETIQEMGKELIKTRDFSERGCDLILEGYYG